MSSTTIIIKAFDELNVRKKDFAQLVFGTLVMEDIAGIFMMIILSTISVSKSISAARWRCSWDCWCCIWCCGWCWVSSCCPRC